MNKFEEEIEKRYGSFEISHDKNKLITDDIKTFTTDVAIKFAEWLSNKRYIHQDRNLYLAPFPVVGILTTEELFEIFINNHYGK